MNDKRNLGDASTETGEQKPKKKRVVKKKINQSEKATATSSKAVTAVGEGAARTGSNHPRTHITPPTGLMGLAAACGSPVDDVHSVRAGTAAASNESSTSRQHDIQPQSKSTHSRSHTRDSSYSTSSSLPPLTSDTGMDTAESAASTPRTISHHPITQMGTIQRHEFASGNMNTSALISNGMDFGTLSPHLDPHIPSPRDLIFRQHDSHFSFMENLSPEPNSAKISSNQMIPKPMLHEYTHPHLPNDGRSLLHLRRNSLSSRFIEQEDEATDDRQRQTHDSTIDGLRVAVGQGQTASSDDDEDLEEEDEALESLHDRGEPYATTASASSTPSLSARIPCIIPRLPDMIGGTSKPAALEPLPVPMTPSSGSAPTTPMSRLHFFSAQCPTVDTTLLPSPRVVGLSRLQQASMNQELLKQRLKKEGKMSDIESSDEEQMQAETDQPHENHSDRETEPKAQLTASEIPVKTQTETMVESSERALKHPNQPRRLKKKKKQRIESAADRTKRSSLPAAAATSEDEIPSVKLFKTATSALERASRLNRRNSLSEERKAAQTHVNSPASMLTDVEDSPSDKSKMSTCELCQHQFIGSYGGGRFCGARCARQFSINKRWRRS